MVTLMTLRRKKLARASSTTVPRESIREVLGRKYKTYLVTELGSYQSSF